MAADRDAVDCSNSVGLWLVDPCQPSEKLKRFLGNDSSTFSKFEVDEDGRFLHWPHSDTHLGWKQLQQLIDGMQFDFLDCHREYIIDNAKNAKCLNRIGAKYLWLATDGRYLAVIWELVDEDPRVVYPVTLVVGSGGKGAGVGRSVCVIKVVKWDVDTVVFCSRPTPTSLPRG